MQRSISRVGEIAQGVWACTAFGEDTFRSHHPLWASRLPVATVLENLMPSAATGAQIAYIHTNTHIHINSLRKIFKKQILCVRSVCKNILCVKLSPEQSHYSIITQWIHPCFPVLQRCLYLLTLWSITIRSFCLLEKGKLNQNK